MTQHIMKSRAMSVIGAGVAALTVGQILVVVATPEV